MTTDITEYVTNAIWLWNFTIAIKILSEIDDWGFWKWAGIALAILSAFILIF